MQFSIVLYIEECIRENENRIPKASSRLQPKPKTPDTLRISDIGSLEKTTYII